MRAYLVRRFLLMIPTLFGVTLVTFFIMRLAPGDPLKMQLSSGGAQGESQNTREAYVLQRRQWKLDKPAFLNLGWFRSWGGAARHAARFRALDEDGLARELERLAGAGGAADPALGFLQGLGIEGFDGLLADPQRRPQLLRRVPLAVQIFVEENADPLMRPLVALLKEGDDALRIGAIRCLNLATLGSPFIYGFTRDPDPEESEAVLATWDVWWRRAKDALPAPGPERKATLDAFFAAQSAQPSRMKILQAFADLAAEGGLRREDAAYFADRLFRDGAPLREQLVAALGLVHTAGRPLRTDLPPSPGAEDLRIVSENWTAYVESQSARYDPSLPRRLWRLVADTQYANSLWKLVTFNFGRSMVKPYDPVGKKILDAALVSAPLMFWSSLLIYAIAIPAGILCAVRRGKAADRVVSTTLFVLYSVPSFVAAMLFLTFFCYGGFLKVFPMYGLHSEGSAQWGFFARSADYAWHAFGPIVCLSIFSLAGLAMYARTSLLEVIGHDYIRTARAKGLAEKTVIYKHALRNGLIPVITLFASFIPGLLSGSVLIEFLFGIPGMGRLSLESILAKDYNTLMAIIYIDAIVVMVSILLTDLLYVLVDPRISFGKSGGGA